MIVQILRYVCDQCDRRQEEQQEIALDKIRTVAGLPGLPGVVVPPGWTQVGLQLLCPLHQVVIDPRPGGI